MTFRILILTHALMLSAAFGQWNVTALTTNVSPAEILDFSFLQAATSTANVTSYTFSNQNLGTADANRQITIAIVGHRQSGTIVTPSVTAAGISASLIVEINNGIQYAGIWSASVPTTTTGDVIVNWNSINMARCGVAMYRLVGTPSTHDTGTSTATNPTDTINVAQGGVVIGVGAERTSGSTTWTGLTERWDAAIETAMTGTSAGDGSMTLETGRTITIDFTGTDNPIGAFASFSP